MLCLRAGSFKTTACLGAACLATLTLAQTLPAQDSFLQTAPKARAASAVRVGVGPTSYLGVGMAEVTEERAKAVNLKDPHGAEVKHVEENSPAAKAGLKEGDVILDYNSQRVEGVDQFIRMISETPAGRKVNVTVWRNNSNQTLTATLEARNRNTNAFFMSDGVRVAPFPPMPPNAPDFQTFEKSLGDLGSRFSIMTMNNQRVGVETESLTAQLADFFGVKQGVLVRSVVTKSAAERAGIKAGDVITKVGGTPVLSAREITGAVNAAKGKVSFTIVRNKKEMTLDLEVPEAHLTTPDRAVL